MSFVELIGQAKLDRRTKDLVKRLSSEDIAIIDHTDLDRVSAEELVESGVRVVVNVSPSQSGRFPNPGPLALVRSGVRLIDAPGVEEPHCLPLAKAADAAFVAIALDHTPRETVQEALEHLHLHKAHVAGCVITDAPT